MSRNHTLHIKAILTLCWQFRRSLVVSGIVLLFIWWSSPGTAFVTLQNPRWKPVCWSPDGTTLAAVAQPDRFVGPNTSGSIQLLRVADLSELGSPIDLPLIAVGDRQDAPIVHDVKFSPTGTQLAVLQTHRDREVRNKNELLLIDLSTGTVQKSFSLQYHSGMSGPGPQEFCFSPDGRLLSWHEVSVAGDGEPAHRRDLVTVWDIIQDRQLFSIEGVRYPVFSPDGSRLATVDRPGSEAKACRLNAAVSGQLVATLPLPGDCDGWRPLPQFSADNRFLAVGSRSSRDGKQRVTVFVLDSNEMVLDVEEWSPSFVADSTLVTATQNSVRFRSGFEVAPAELGGFGLSRGMFDGQLIPPQPVTAPGTATVVVLEAGGWDLPLIEPLARLCGFGSSLSPRLSILDAVTGRSSSFRLDTALLEDGLLSPDGKRILLNCAGSTSLWQLPPTRSLRPLLTFAAGMLLLQVCRLVAVFRLRHNQPQRQG